MRLQMFELVRTFDNRVITPATIKKILDSGLFDPAWYSTRYADVSASGLDPLDHYLRYGIAFRRDPCAYFDTAFYLDQGDIGTEIPLLHYLERGASMGLDPHPEFNSRSYWRSHSDVARAGVNPLVHYLKSGKSEGRKVAPSQRKHALERSTGILHGGRPGSATSVERREEPVVRPAQRALRRTSRAVWPRLPKVSIIVLTRDGADLLDTMLRSFKAVNTYGAVEFHIVDHASKDDTLPLLERWSRLLPLRVSALQENHSFSFSNNRAIESADGELVLLLNNDIEFVVDVLPRMVAVLADESIGAVGVRQHSSTPEEGPSERAFHLGTRFRWSVEGRFLRPVNVGYSLQDAVLAQNLASFPAVNGAMLLCRRADYLKVGGLEEAYFYGYEDVDFCCKIRGRLGKDVVSCNDVFVHHNESTTRDKVARDTVSSQRRNNVEALKQRFDYGTRRDLRRQLGDDDGSYFDRRYRVGFAVTTDRFDHGAGDLYTAWGLGEALRQEFGWDVEYVPKTRWYEVHELDMFVAMRHDFDLRDLKRRQPHLVTVAWMRNWLEKWVEAPCLEDFDAHLCGSKLGAAYVEEKAAVSSTVFPIAVAAWHFGPGAPLKEHECDYLFTGNYWEAEVPREVEALDPQVIPHRFGLYGKNWEKHPRFRAYHRGFLSYFDMPKLYSSAPITIDDTVTHVTKLWGALNSRVFEALACGSLVLTNNEIGSEEFFDGRLPVWKDTAELTELISYFTDNPGERQQLVEDLRAMVLDGHTFARRARLLRDVTAFDSSRFRIAIKCPVPRWDEAEAWGDYHFARSLQRALRRLGHWVRVDILPDWQCDAAMDDDAVIVLRGLSRYEPSPDQINVCWMISHPQDCDASELEGYDHVFVASDPYASKLAAKLRTPVSSLLQCSDPHVFNREGEQEPVDHALLFVGNSRRKPRKAVTAAVEQGLDLAVYGRDWEEFLSRKHLRGQYVPNRELGAYYRNADIVLNDHWQDMAQEGFLSNRLFDVAMAGGFVISDTVAGAEAFNDLVPMFDSPDELRDLVVKWSADPAARRARSRDLHELVRERHTFDRRAEEILSVIAALHETRESGPFAYGAESPSES